MRHPLPIGVALVLTAAGLFAGLGSASAQIVDVAPFEVATPSEAGASLSGLDAAAAPDGSMLFSWRDRTSGGTVHRKAYVHHFSSTGAALGAPVRIESTDDVLDTHLASGHGGYIANWRRLGNGTPLDTRLLALTGAPSGTVSTVGTGAITASVAALPNGSVAVWSVGSAVRGRRYDTTGQPTGAAFDIAPSTPSRARVAATSTGGFVAVWANGTGAFARVYDGNGTALGAVIPLTTEFELGDVAASPLGGFAIVGVRLGDDYALPRGVWMRRFDASGSPLAPATLVDLAALGITPVPSCEYDPQGHLYVAWALTGSTSVRPRARAYDAAGRALGPSFLIASETSQSGFATAVRTDGRLVNLWRTEGDLHANVLALCTPPYFTGCGDGAVTSPCETCDQAAGNSDTTPNGCRTNCHSAACGDGVVDSGEECDDGNGRNCDGCDVTCDLEAGYVCGDGTIFAACGEQCDDGPNNDDTTPNACRTDCQLSACGDGVIDDGEACDDGNVVSCDGCSGACVAEPGLVCGDGIPELACDEQCDDGNTQDGDGCKTACLLERVPGGAGGPRGDCLMEWVVNNPSNQPRYDRHGGISGDQQCVDGDPACDFDGTGGTCTFHVRVCANNTDIEGCSPAPRLASWDLRAPSLNRAAKDPVSAAVRAAFAGVPSAIVGPSARDVCSGTLSVVVPLRTVAGSAKKARVTVKARVETYENEHDTDKLKLTCLPPGS